MGASAWFGVSAGQWVRIEGLIEGAGRVGRAKRVVDLSSAMDARVASTDRGWWPLEDDPERLYDVTGLGGRGQHRVGRVRHLTSQLGVAKRGK